MMHVNPESLAALTPAKAKTEAMKAFDEACSNPAFSDWRGLSMLLHAALTAKPKRKTADDDTPEWWSCYDYGKKAVRTSIQVQFSDGRIVRASVNSDPGKPFNIGRGLKTVIAYYRERIFRLLGRPNMTARTFAPDGRELPAWTAHIDVPAIDSVTRLDTGETFDAVECSRLTTEWRAGAWRLSDAMLEAHAMDLPHEDNLIIHMPIGYEPLTFWAYVVRSFKVAWFSMAGTVDDVTFLSQKHAAEIAAFEDSLQDDDIPTVEACEDTGETMLADEAMTEADIETVRSLTAGAPQPSILRKISASLTSSVHPWPSIPVKPAFSPVRLAH